METKKNENSVEYENSELWKENQRILRENDKLRERIKLLEEELSLTETIRQAQAQLIRHLHSQVLKFKGIIFEEEK